MVKKSLQTLTESYFDENPWTKTADLTIGCLYLVCFTFGVPNNIASLCFFARRCFRSRPNITTYLYSITSLQDTVISILALYSGLIMLRNRDDWDPRLCSVHFILFVISERMSVFLVAVLSITRTYTLVYPMRRINLKSILTWLAIIWVLIASSTSLPTLLEPVNIQFHRHDGYCWIEIEDRTLKVILTSMNMLGIATPIIPILVSCVISIHKVKRSQKTKFGSIKLTKQGRKKMQRTSHQMTLTIILVALLYILLKIPLFINYLLYLITVLLDKYPGPFYFSPFMYLYSWNITFMLCTAVNACTNSIIYITRFKRYRKWLKSCCKRQSAMESSVTSRGTFMSSRMFEMGHSEYRSNIMHSAIEDTGL